MISGKSKDIKIVDNHAICTFRDDLTAFNKEKHDILPGKGKIGNAINTYIMSFLGQHGIETHFIEQIDDTSNKCYALDMIPIEFVIRNYAAGSICNKFGYEKFKQFDAPFIDLYMKNDHDPMISYDMVCSLLLDKEDLDYIMLTVHKINLLLSGLFYSLGLIFIDGKFEFGFKKGSNDIVLGDEISLDSIRIIDIKDRQFRDKELYRSNASLDEVYNAYKDVLERIKKI